MIVAKNEARSLPYFQPGGGCLQTSTTPSRFHPEGREMYRDSMEARGSGFTPLGGEMYMDRQHTARLFSPRQW